MPTSSPEGKGWIARSVVALGPATLLDVGPGVGTYADLLRPSLPSARWACVEVHEPYVDDYGLRQKYDDVHVADVRSFPWPRRYDIVILGDVLEHLPLADALAVWRAARAHAGHVVLSLPIVEHPQGPQHGNVHEAHLHTWRHEAVLATLPGIRRWWCSPRIGVYLATGDEPATDH
jgi:2-polyprenyl-3-methyl-5-hydroxy-6-metoxy-1,4-benzoquinol methylase